MKGVLRSQQGTRLTRHVLASCQNVSRNSDRTRCGGARARDAIKSGGAAVVAMHFDAVIIRRVTYASLPRPPSLPPSAAIGVSPEFLNAFFDAVRRPIAGISSCGYEKEEKKRDFLTATQR